MMYGSVVLRVVFTVIDPSSKLSSQAIPSFFKSFVMLGHFSLKYASLYLGKSVAKDDLKIWFTP